MKARQRDGPSVLKRFFCNFIYGLLMDVAVASIFLGVGAFMFGPINNATVFKAAITLIFGVFCLLLALAFMILKIIISVANKKK